MQIDIDLLIGQLYPDFNARNIDQILPLFSTTVDWPNGMTGGREIGHDAVREYWTNQWQQISSKVTPISYRLVDEKIALEVQQTITDMEGEVISSSVVFHTWCFENGKVARMDISEDVPDFAAAIPKLEVQHKID